MPVPSFTAVTDCPKCGQVDIHWIDETAPPPSEEDMADFWAAYAKWEAEPWEEPDQIVNFGGTVVKTGPLRKKYPAPTLRDESHFECVRVCTSCNHRWGMK